MIHPGIENRKQTQARDVTRFPSDRVHFVSRSELTYLSDLTYTMDMKGNLHYCARIIPKGEQVESAGDYDNRVKLARVELERLMNERGFEFWLDRDTDVSGAHVSTGQSYDYMGKVAAATLFGTFRRTNDVDDQRFPPAQVPSYRYQFTPAAHRQIIEKYEDLIGSKLRSLKASSKGQAITNANFLCPNPMLGIVEHNGFNTTWQDFSAMLVTNSAAVADENPHYEIFTRPSLLKDDAIKGIPSAPTAIEWYGLSCQMKIEGFKKIQSAGSREEREERRSKLREKISKKQTTRRQRLPSGALEPFKEGMVHVTKLQDPVLENRRYLNNPINGSPPNPESGYVLHQIIAPGEECGMLGDPQVLHHHLQLNRLYEMALEEIERYGEDLTLTQKEKEDSLDSQIEFATMTIGKTDGTPAFTGRTWSNTERRTWQITSPARQHSKFWRTKQTYYLPNGKAILRFKDPKTGRLMYHEPYSGSAMHATRDQFNIACAEGIVSEHGYWAKFLSSEAPNDMDMLPEMVTALHKIRYANHMPDTFRRAGYWMCGVFADIQSFGYEFPGFKRLLLFHTGEDKEVRLGKKTAPLSYTGYQDVTTRGGVEFKEFEKLKKAAESNPRLAQMYKLMDESTQRIKRLAGFDDHLFELRRDKNGLFPWFDEKSPFYVFMEARHLDQREAARIEWVHPLKFKSGKQQAGYLRFMQYGGIDAELPLHCYLQLFCASVVNLYEEIHQEVAQHVPAHLRHKVEVDIHQTDGTRDWNSFYEFMRLPDTVRDHLSDKSSSFMMKVAEQALAKGGFKRQLNRGMVADFQVAFNSEKAMEVFRHGKEKPAILDSYFEAATTSFEKRLIAVGLSSQEVSCIVTALKQSRRMFHDEFHKSSMKGGFSDPLITRTYNSAITFLIGFSARVKITWPVDKDRPDSDHEPQVTSKGGFRPTMKVGEVGVPTEVEENALRPLLSSTIDTACSIVKDQARQAVMDCIGSYSSSDSSSYVQLQNFFQPWAKRFNALASNPSLFSIELKNALQVTPTTKNKLELWLEDGGKVSEYDGDAYEDCLTYLMHCLIVGEDPGNYFKRIFSLASCEILPSKSNELKRTLTAFFEPESSVTPEDVHNTLIDTVIVDSTASGHIAANASAEQRLRCKETIKKIITSTGL